MPDISTTYGGSGVTTQTSGLPSLPGGGGAQMPDFAALMRYKLAQDALRAQQEAALRDAQIRAMRAQAQPQRMMGMQALAQERPSESLNDIAARNAAKQAQLRILEASSRPVPTKFITGGAGILGGYAPDTTLLPQALLPANAGFERGGLTESQFAQVSPEGQRSLLHQQEQERTQREYAQPTSITNRLMEEQRRQQEEEDLRRQQQAQRQNAYYGR